MYYLLLPDLATRTALIAHLKAKGVLAVFHYLGQHAPVRNLPAAGAAGRGDCPVTEIGQRPAAAPCCCSMPCPPTNRRVL